MRTSLVTRPSWMPKYVPKAGDGCVLWIPMQDDPQSVVVRDRSGNGNHGTINGASWARTGKGLWYLEFDLVDDYITCGDDTSLDITASLTLELWMKPDRLDTTIMFILGRDDGTNRNYALQQEANGTLQLSLWIGGVRKEVISDTVVSAAWTHIVTVYNQTDMRFYTNGLLDCTPTVQAGNIDNDDVGFVIGARDVGWDRDFDGGIALPRVYNVALSAEVIATHRRDERHHFGV